MTNLPLTLPHHHLSLSLADRVTGGRMIWMFARVVLGGLFLVSGSQKLMGLDQFAQTLVKGGIPETMASVLAPVAAVAETLGGLCIMVGFATGWACLLMMVFVMVAAFVSHRFWEFDGEMRMLQQNHFLKNIMITCGFALLYVAGGGPCSIDRWRRFNA